MTAIPSSRRSVRRSLVAVLAVTGLVLSACGGDDASDSDATEAPAETTAAPADTAGGGAGGEITVGSANFPESQLLAEIYGQALEAIGVTVNRTLNIGSREVYYAAIESGEVDLLPEYSGSLLSYVLRQADPDARPTATDIPSQIAELEANLPEGLTVLTPSSAEDKDVIVCRAEVAEQYSLTNLSELAEVAGEITLGAPPEFEERAPFGLVGFAEIYGAEFAEFVPLNIGGVVDSLIGGSIDCGNLFSTMSVITTEGLVPLDDDQTLVPNEAVLPLIRTDVLTDEITAALDAVNAVLTTDELKAMMVQIEVDAADPAAVAAEFLTAQGLA